MRRILLSILILALATPLIGRADTLILENIDQARSSSAERPTRGMSMDRVSAGWGTPLDKGSAVGQPPITRWEYADFIVYFEYDHVIHAVTKRS